MTYHVTAPQAQDHQIASKMDGGRLVLKSLYRILRLLLMLDDTAYVPAIISNICLWEHQRVNRLPAWQMFLQNASFGNEEPGELSFAVLGRATQKDPHGNDFKHMDTMYRQLRTYMNASQGFRIGEHLSAFYASGRKFTGSQEGVDVVEATTEHFKSLIRHVKSNVPTMYDGSDDGFASIKHAATHQLQIKTLVRFTEKDVKGVLLKKCGALYNRMTKVWMDEKNFDIWPEARPEPSLDSPPPEETDSGNEGEDERADEMLELDRSDGDDLDHKHEDSLADTTAAHLALRYNNNPDSEEDDDNSGDRNEWYAEDPFTTGDEDDAYAEEAPVVPVRPPNDKELRFKTYERKTQQEKEQVWKDHNSIAEANVLNAKRKRKTADQGPVVSNETEFW